MRSICVGSRVFSTSCVFLWLASTGIPEAIPLPDSSSTTTAGGVPALKITNTGLGLAGYFQLTNSANTNPSLRAETNGRGIALFGYMTGLGRAGLFQINNPANSNSALQALTSGIGQAGYFQITNPSNPSHAVVGSTVGTGAGVYGETSGFGWGVYGTSVSSIGVYGQATDLFDGTGVYGKGGTGVAGFSELGIAGSFISNEYIGVYGWGDTMGVYGVGRIGPGVVGEGTTSGGWDRDTDTDGVEGDSGNGYGVLGQSSIPPGKGVVGIGYNGADGVVGKVLRNQISFPFGRAGVFVGDVAIIGNLTKSGGSFKIDHPLDPTNKYLSHSFVESPDMKDVYDGLAVLNGKGQAVVLLPDWFEALNRDFRYQLTAIGAPAPNLYIAQELVNNQFTIAGGRKGLKVSWQVTGIRQDAWANAHRIPVEEVKSPAERGFYIHPELFGAGPQQSIEEVRRPDQENRLKALTNRHFGRSNLR